MAITLTKSLKKNVTSKEFNQVFTPHLTIEKLKVFEKAKKFTLRIDLFIYYLIFHLFCRFITFLKYLNTPKYNSLKKNYIALM